MGEGGVGRQGDRVASQYHDVAPDEDERRRGWACWLTTKRTRPGLYARALAALAEAERRTVTDQLAALEALERRGRRWS